MRFRLEIRLAVNKYIQPVLYLRMELSVQEQQYLVSEIAREPEEIDDWLESVALPDFYKRTFRHPYLQARGFVFDDYEYFPVGTTGKLNSRYADYAIFPVIDEELQFCELYVNGGYLSC